MPSYEKVKNYNYRVLCFIFCTLVKGGVKN